MKMKKIGKMIRERKGISTILAALLMVVIVVVASVMVYAWSTGLLGTLLVTPTAGKEALNLESSAFNTFGASSCASGSTTCSNVTLYIRNTGSASVAFTTYYVKDSAGNTWTQSAWATGPTISPNQVGLANIIITGATYTGQTTGATYSGTTNAFNTFTSGNSYTITAVTSRNNQFVFTVIR